MRSKQLENFYKKLADQSTYKFPEYLEVVQDVWSDMNITKELFDPNSIGFFTKEEAEILSQEYPQARFSVMYFQGDLFKLEAENAWLNPLGGAFLANPDDKNDPEKLLEAIQSTTGSDYYSTLDPTHLLHLTLGVPRPTTTLSNPNAEDQIWNSNGWAVYDHVEGRGRGGFDLTSDMLFDLITRNLFRVVQHE